MQLSHELIYIFTYLWDMITLNKIFVPAVTQSYALTPAKVAHCFILQ